MKVIELREGQLIKPQHSAFSYRIAGFSEPPNGAKGAVFVYLAPINGGRRMVRTTDQIFANQWINCDEVENPTPPAKGIDPAPTCCTYHKDGGDLCAECWEPELEKDNG